MKRDENEKKVQPEDSGSGTSFSDKGKTDAGGPADEMPEKNGLIPPKPEPSARPSADKPGQEAVSEKDAVPPSSSEQPDAPEEPDPRHGCLHTLIYGVTVTAFSALLAIGILLAACDVFGVLKPDRKIDVEIPKGATSGSIAHLLQKDGVIRFGPIFRIYTHFTKASNFHPGIYMLDSGMGYDAILATLGNSANNQQLVKVTIPEGKTLRQIGQILEDNKVCSSADFLTQVEAGGFKFPFDSQIPHSASRFYRYEGYLFPDTYEFYRNSTGKSAAQKMLGNFSAKFTSAMVRKASSLGFTVDQTVTLASIVQSEAGKTDQMGKVASVFENRLKNGVKDNGGKHFLQSDATIFYVLRDIQNNSTPTASQTAISSAYNTYKAEGLPPGPICNPGLAAIQVVLDPPATKYYYFVSDSSGNYYYSTTYAEHQKAVKKAMKSGGAKGTNVFK